MNRRHFLSTATSLGAASYLRIAGANDRIGMALVGAGARGRGVMKALVGTGKVNLTGVCDVYDLPRQEARKLLPDGPAPFETQALDDVLTRKDVDAVLIATPDHLHCGYTLSALAAGKHVYLEKPTTHALDEGAKLTAAVKKSGKVLQSGMQQRSGAHYLRARSEIFQPKRLGDVLFVRSSWADFPRQRRRFDPAAKPATLDWARFLGPAPKVPYHPQRYETWRYYPEYGGGLLADILTHWADVAQWMMGDAQPVTATVGGGIYQLDDGRKNPDTVHALIQYQRWTLEFASTVLPVKTRATVVFEGTEGTLDLSRDGYTLTPRGGKPETVKADPASLDRDHATSFVQAVLGGGVPTAPIEIGVEACRPVHLATAAYWRKKPTRYAGARIVAG